MVGEPGKRSRAASSRLSIKSGSRSSERSTSRSSASASGWDGQPSHHRNSTLMDLHTFDLGIRDRPVLRSSLEALDGVDGAHAGGHAPKDRVLAVEPGRGVGRDDEELAAVRVRAGIGHRKRAADDLVLVDLVLELVARTAGPGAERAAALDHEVLDHTVEDQAVVVAVP